MPMTQNMQPFPFTIQYAREQAPREVWDNPLFMRLNVILTVAFGLMFTVNAGLEVIALVRPGDAVTIRGQKKGAGPVVTAVAVTNDATGAVADTGPHGPPQHLDDESRINLQLH